MENSRVIVIDIAVDCRFSWLGELWFYSPIYIFWIIFPLDLQWFAYTLQPPKNTCSSLRLASVKANWHRYGAVGHHESCRTWEDIANSLTIPKVRSKSFSPAGRKWHKSTRKPITPPRKSPRWCNLHSRLAFKPAASSITALITLYSPGVQWPHKSHISPDAFWQISFQVTNSQLRVAALNGLLSGHSACLKQLSVPWHFRRNFSSG